MKTRFLTLLLLVVVLLFGSTTYAAPQTIDLETMTLEELTALVEEANARINDLTPKPTPKPYGTYYKIGSKGDGVRAIQERLIELQYLTGKADGSYGEQTSAAITAFQRVAGLAPTGIAYPETQARLFASDAPENPEPDPSTYDKLNYKAVARDPDAYEGKLIRFTGKVIQVIEGDGNTAEYRVATSGSYGDVVYVAYDRPDGASRVLEDDKVTVYGLCAGVISYQSTMGGKITIPACYATSIEIK